MLSNSQVSCSVGKQKDLCADGKHVIVQYVAKEMKMLDISGEMKRDHGTVERFVCAKGVLRKVTHRFKRAAVKKATDEQQTGIRSCWCLNAGSSRGLLMCIQLYFIHPEPMPTRRNDHSGLRNT